MSSRIRRSFFSVGVPDWRTKESWGPDFIKSELVLDGSQCRNSTEESGAIGNLNYFYCSVIMVPSTCWTILQLGFFRDLNVERRLHRVISGRNFLGYQWNFQGDVVFYGGKVFQGDAGFSAVECNNVFQAFSTLLIHYKFFKWRFSSSHTAQLWRLIRDGFVLSLRANALVGWRKKKLEFSDAREKKKKEKGNNFEKKNKRKNTDVFHGIFQNDWNRRLSRGTSEAMIPWVFRFSRILYSALGKNLNW